MKKTSGLGAPQTQRLRQGPHRTNRASSMGASPHLRRSRTASDGPTSPRVADELSLSGSSGSRRLRLAEAGCPMMSRGPPTAPHVEGGLTLLRSRVSIRAFLVLIAALPLPQVLNLSPRRVSMARKLSYGDAAMPGNIEFVGDEPWEIFAHSARAEASSDQVTLLFRVARQDQPAFRTVRVTMTVSEGVELLGRLKATLSGQSPNQPPSV
jgi:hypothetical protein